MNPVVHFEMPYDSSERVAAFYQSAFGWKLQAMGEAMGNYVLAITTPSSDSGPTNPGAINGGFFARHPDSPMQYPSVVISVDDIQQAAQGVAGAGGAVLGEPMDIPGVGKYAVFTDTEGNRVGMLQPLMRKQPAPKPAAKKRKTAPARKAKPKRPTARKTSRRK
jgi:predicted enzyme related to lactoylglutathione lyase